MRVCHQRRGKGIVVRADFDDPRGKPFTILFDRHAKKYNCGNKHAFKFKQVLDRSEQATRVRHPDRGEGFMRLLPTESTPEQSSKLSRSASLRIKPFLVHFDNGEIHAYAAQSAAKLDVVQLDGAVTPYQPEPRPSARVRKHFEVDSQNLVSNGLLERLMRRRRLERTLGVAVRVFLVRRNLQRLIGSRELLIGACVHVLDSGLWESCLVAPADSYLEYTPLEIADIERDGIALMLRCNASGHVLAVSHEDVSTLRGAFPDATLTSVVEALLVAGGHRGWARLLLRRSLQPWYAHPWRLEAAAVSIQRYWRGHSLRRALWNAGAFLEDFRDPERQAKIERSRSMKCKARAARLITATMRGHLVRLQLRRDGPAAYTDPDRKLKIRMAAIRPRARKKRSVEEDAAARVVASLKGHLVRSRAATPLKTIRARLRDAIRPSQASASQRHTIRDDDGEERISMWWADFLFEREDAQALTTRSASDVALDMVWM
jgi:hypothetical protein